MPKKQHVQGDSYHETNYLPNRTNVYTILGGSE
jgi:hypothetical protein